ncbi:hypothetical protein BDZ94DRAFT_31366 [Collybia nuda]|uniref:Uncharacterized protein n=1 Tax=Collybia nuda TaxID=64659 RepID=A0A9P5YH54_9AGAR|nr:hypothetical protein BDZ94DRAFT_31366 [Collybia nuda]
MPGKLTDNFASNSLWRSNLKVLLIARRAGPKHMYRLTHRPCAGHCVPQTLATIVRFNSTKPESVVPQAPSPPATKVHIASSWGDLFIPSREEILRKSRPSGRNKANPYSPNLHYLDKSSDTSLAGRLAKQWRKQEAPVQTPPSIIHSQTRLEVYHPDAKIVPSPEIRPRESRVDHTIAQRRAERLARETAQKAKVRTPRQWTQETGQYEQRMTVGGQSQRSKQQFEGTENANNGSATEPGRRFYNNKNSSQHMRRGSTNTGKSDSQMRSGQRDARGRTLGRLVITRARKIKEDEGGESKEDISLEILEEGCDTKVPSALTAPDPPLADLNGVFGNSSITSLNVITTRQPSNSNVQQSKDRAQWIKETFGGDYARFAPQPPYLYLESHRTLGPSKHAELVLSKRRDVLIANRHRAQAIIESATIRSV